MIYAVIGMVLWFAGVAWLTRLLSRLGKRAQQAAAAADAEYRKQLDANAQRLWRATQGEVAAYHGAALRAGLCARAAFDVDEAMREAGA